MKENGIHFTSTLSCFTILQPRYLLCMCVCVCVCVCVRERECVSDPPASSVYGVFQATILEWVAILFCRESFQSRGQIWVSCIAGDSLLAEPPGKPSLTFLLMDYWVNLGRAHTQALSTDEVWWSQPHPSALGVVTWFKPGPSANPTVPHIGMSTWSNPG